ncbi:hypothetical protein PPACK8108_LOCUS26000 [Phakopsora pachyrhizi]|uniref:Rab-GAP TBC domain-containing protein n=1 Tax=Phakopsora pachyrhizi TaxID=170000 RepID=A0AAV0BT25_PHAPC|nr:hypothetical protein PPACK8108_LOCUS26000 [Phakopsora pachyrhizi]
MDKNAYLKSFQIFLNNNNQSTPQSSKPIDPYLLKHLVLNVFDQLNLTINNNLNHGSRQLSILLPSSSTPKLIIQAPSPTSPSNSKLELELSSINLSQNQNTDESYKFTYRDLLTRLLTVWSALNPGISYVQGMNLIGSVLIYVYKNTNLRNHSTPGQPVHHSDFDIKDTQEEDLSKHFENVEADTCFDLLDLIKIWDSILAIKLNTMTHQAQKTSEEDDSNQIIQESLLLWQQQSAEDLNDELPFRTFSRAQTKIGDKEIEDEPFWEEDFEEDGFNKYKGPWLGTSISRLASRFPWTPDTCHRGPPRTDWDMGLSAQNRLSRNSQGTVDEVKKQIELGLLGSSKGRIQLVVLMNLHLKFRNKERTKEIQDLSQSLDMTNDDSRENRREPTRQ